MIESRSMTDGGAATAPDLPPGPPTLTETAIPAGRWLRSPGAGAAEPVPELWGSPYDTRYTVLVGRPGERTPAVADVATVVRSLASDVRDRMVLTVYGAEPSAEHCFAQGLADLLGSPVRAHHGVVLADRDAIAHRTMVDAEGRPTWRPFAQASCYRPGRVGPEVELWRAPFQGAVAVGRGSYRLAPGWTVDVVPAGLVVHRAQSRPEPLLSCAPADPDRVQLVIEAGEHGALLEDMLPALGRLADALPKEARARLQVVLTPGGAAASARALRCAVPAPQVVWTRPTAVAVAVVEPLPEVPSNDSAVEAVNEPEPAELTPVLAPVEALEPLEAFEPVAAQPLPSTKLAVTLAVSASGRMLLV
jgi:hypothetical protein